MNSANKEKQEEKYDDKCWQDEAEKAKYNFFRVATVLLFGLIIAALVYLASYVSVVVNIVGFSILISYLLIGLVDWLQVKSKIKKRGIIVLFIYFLVFLLFCLFSFFVLPTVIDQIKQLANQVPLFLTDLESFLSSLGQSLGQNQMNEIFDLKSVSGEIASSVANLGKLAVPKVLNFAFDTINFAVYFLATIVLSIYFLLDGPKIWQGAIRPLSEKYAYHAENLRHDLSRCLRGYFVGQIQLAALSGLYMFFIYLLFGSKYALLLAILQGLLEIIPVVGGFLGIGLGVLVLLFLSPWKALIALLLYLFYTQIIKDNFITPRIMGDAINLHPVVILIVVLIGAQVGGISGVVFALPVAGLLNVILNYYLKNRYENKIKVNVNE